MFQNLQPSEIKKLEEFFNNRPNPEAYTGAIGGRYTYSMTPTTLGCVYIVRDNLLKEDCDITDYNWQEYYGRR